MKHLKVAIAVMPIVMLIGAGTVYAAPVSSFHDEACSGLTELSNTTTNACSGTTATTPLIHLIGEVVNILSLFIGAVAVIMIIIAGLRFVTASGDSNAVAGAKGTLMWALVGLAVAVLAQVIVHWVLNFSSSFI